MLRVGTAFLDPAFEDRDLRRREAAVGRDGRHAPGLLVAGDALIQGAGFRLAGQQRDGAAMIGRSAGEGIEAQVGHALLAVLAMAVKAILRENRTNVATVVEARRSSGQAEREHREREAIEECSDAHIVSYLQLFFLQH